MPDFYHLTKSSTNKKTGPIPVSTTSRSTCPDTCAFKGAGCYAEHGPLRLHWDKISEGERNAMSFKEFLVAIKNLPRGQLWRHAQAGDLPKNPDDMLKLAEANQGKRVIAYTHHRYYKELKVAAKIGFHVNLSANSLKDADKQAKTGLPVTVVLDSFYEKHKDESLREYRQRVGGSLSFSTPAGNRVAICPATYVDTNCAKCQVCSRPRTGGTIIGFPAHGTARRRANTYLSTRGKLSQWITPSEVRVT